MRRNVPNGPWLSLLNKAGGSQTTLLFVISEIHTTQDDAGRRALEFPRHELLDGALFNLIAQSHELHFALGLGPLGTRLAIGASVSGSGLSRSDLVLWPIAPFRFSADHGRYRGITGIEFLRIMEKHRKLVLREDVNELIDTLCGMVLTHLSSLPARCTPGGDLASRRAIERVVFDVRTDIAKACSEAANERNEPPLDQQG